jgi:hypothetical protein
MRKRLDAYFKLTNPKNLRVESSAKTASRVKAIINCPTYSAVYLRLPAFSESSNSPDWVDNRMQVEGKTMSELYLLRDKMSLEDCFEKVHEMFVRCGGDWSVPEQRVALSSFFACMKASFEDVDQAYFPAKYYEAKRSNGTVVETRRYPAANEHPSIGVGQNYGSDLIGSVPLKALGALALLRLKYEGGPGWKNNVNLLNQLKMRGLADVELPTYVEGDPAANSFAIRSLKAREQFGADPVKIIVPMPFYFTEGTPGIQYYMQGGHAGYYRGAVTIVSPRDKSQFLDICLLVASGHINGAMNPLIDAKFAVTNESQVLRGVHPDSKKVGGKNSPVTQQVRLLTSTSLPVRLPDEYEQRTGGVGQYSGFGAFSGMDRASSVKAMEMGQMGFGAKRMKPARHGIDNAVIINPTTITLGENLVFFRTRTAGADSAKSADRAEVEEAVLLTSLKKRKLDSEGGSRAKKSRRDN